MNQRYIIGICGASGSVYAVALLSQLLRYPLDIHVAVTADGRTVMAQELGYAGELKAFVHKMYPDTIAHPHARLITHEVTNFFAPPASGSFKHEGMIIVPCTVKTVAAVAAGLADNLLTRAADICLKERRPLVVVPRETPLSAVHLENMLRLTRAGATIMPAAPAFYFNPQSVQDLVDFMVARIMDHLGLEHQLIGEWGGETLV